MDSSATRALRRNLIESVVVLALVVLAGTAGFYAIGGGQAPWVDALYMAVITVTTIGYGEVIPMAGNAPARLFTMAIAVTGLASVWVAFSNFTALLLARTMDPARSRAKLIKETARMHDHYILCGLGRIGANVARELLATGKRFVAIEPSSTAIEAFRLHEGELAEGVLIIQGDASDDDSLRAAGIVHARGVFAVTGEDSQNMLIALTAKQLNPGARLVARVHEVRNVEKARRAGADEIVSPDFTGGLRIANAMLQPLASDFLDEMVRGKEALRVVDVPVPAGLGARRLGDVQLRASEYLVVGLRAGEAWQFNPGPETALAAGTVLIAMATPRGEAQLRQTLGALT